MMAAASLGVLCLTVMMVYAGNKSVVITEVQDLEGKGNLQPLIKVILKEKEQYEYIVLINAAHGGDNKGNGAAHEDEPCAAEDIVKGSIVIGGGGNGTGHEEDQTGQHIDGRSQKGNLIGSLGSKVLGDDVHAHERQPGDQDAAVQGDPVKL